MTEVETIRARALMSGGLSLEQAAEVIGQSNTAALSASLDVLKERRRRYASQNYAGSKWRGSVVSTGGAVTVPDHVIEERKHRATLVPADTTALLMRDPLPGYSARDRAPSIAPSIRSDPLDVLMFRRRKTGARFG